MTTSLFPKFPDDTVLIERDHKFLFLCPSRPDWVVVNKNTAIALKLCDGTRSIEQIKQELSAVHSSSDDAVAIIERLCETGFLDEDNYRKNKREKQKPTLRSVHLNLSRDCNLTCNYCYAEERPLEGKQLSLDEYKALIDDLKTMNDYMEISLTGGEPMLNKNYGKIAEYCREVGFYTHLMTNATLIHKHNAEYIAKTFDVIRTSIDGTTEEFHDFHRGVGTLAKTVRAVDLLLEHGANVRIAMVVTKHNVANVEAMADKYGSLLTFQPLFDAGNAKDTVGLELSGTEYFDALKSPKNIDVIGGIGKHFANMRNVGTTKCAIGDAEISIGHDGSVYSCHMVHLPEFMGGNIREKKLSEIYATSAVLEESRALHTYARPECSECLIRSFCGGSCRARALYLSGDINATDDFCDYEFSAYLDALFNTELTSIDQIDAFRKDKIASCGEACSACY